jgi:hypothetical protein
MVGLEALLQLFDLARAEQCAWCHAGQADDLGPLDVKLWQGRGEGDGFGQAMFGQAAGRGGFQCRMEDIGTRGRCGGVAQTLPLALGKQVIDVVLGAPCDQSSPS